MKEEEGDCWGLGCLDLRGDVNERVREDALHWRKPIDNIRFRYHWQVFYQQLDVEVDFNKK